jgi:uncharacterized surface protein with fasciclin (FAS1) repeats
MKTLLKWISTLSLAGFLAACGGGTNYGNLAEVAQANGFSALGAAVNKAGLTSTLTSPGANLTVFAPTDSAFGTLANQLGFSDAGAMVAALSASDLAKILTYHVIPGTKYAADLKAGAATQPTAYSFEGSASTLAITASSSVSITDAVLATSHVTIADVRANNGVIHVVDKVLVPPGVLNLVQMAQANPGAFSSLVSKVVATDLASTLSGSGPFTVFAPINEAFTTAPSGLSPAQLRSVLLYHVLFGQVLSTAIPFGTPVPTLDPT